MLEANEFKNGFEKDKIDSQYEISRILDSVNYSFDSLANTSEPNILVLGTGPYFPEAHLLSQWAEENKRNIVVDCVDREDIDQTYLDLIVNLRNSEYFKMNFFKANFDEYKYEKEYNLILMLRISDLSSIDDEVFDKVTKSLQKNSHFIMSGGLTNSFNGFSLNNSGINLEKRHELEYSPRDVFKEYPGKNIALKFKKY
ncbi:MAG: hypothetical protein RBS01_02460 [Candidatus Dojkabacteria bacterium]|jgi:hypothetical protein|nr:hypothetical protein [Candidatus Dojkabacteria bacterium]